MNEFDQIYAAGGWDGKGSGPGSTELFTREFRGVFEKLLKERNIKSVFDLGCGDWQWQEHVNWKGIDYLGWDVSQKAIDLAYKRDISKPATIFIEHRDAFSFPLWPEADLLLVKDVLHHVSPFKARMLKSRASFYDYVLWVVDLDKNGWVANQEGFITDSWESIYTFDTSIEDYRYGPKEAFLEINP